MAFSDSLVSFVVFGCFGECCVVDVLLIKAWCMVGGGGYCVWIGGSVDTVDTMDIYLIVGV